MPRFEGDIKVLDNIDEIQSIQAPYPNSPYNQEHWNKMPERDFFQRLLTEAESSPEQAHPAQANLPNAKLGTNDIFASIMSAHLSGDDKALKQAQIAAFNSDLAQNAYNEVRQQNIAMETQLAEQQRQVELEHQQVIAIANPVMTLRR